MQKDTSHTLEARESIRHAMIKRWEKITPQDRSKIMSERRKKGMNGEA